VGLARINTGLLIAIILINGYVLCMPVWPQVSFWWRSRSPQARQALTEEVRQAPSRRASTLQPKQNKIIIPSILLNEPIHVGPTVSELEKGLWLRPNASSPDEQSNTVIVGHRFTYTNPRGTFYFLHKVQPGDEIGIQWEGRTYLYRVRAAKVVPASDLSVEAPTDTPTLTLYTCTPLWNPKDRLVVTASLEQTYE
jgi:sortase A